MGIADRDYFRSQRAAGGGPRVGSVSPWTVSTWLIIINVAVFVIDSIVRVDSARQLGTLPDGTPVTQRFSEGVVFHFGAFSYITAIKQMQIWRFLSFQFLHADAMHLLMNMFGIYFFGPLVESYLGRRRFLFFFLLCGATGPIAYLMFQALGVLILNPAAALIGASAGVFGILVAAAAIAPRELVQLLFLPFPIRLQTMAYLLIGVAAFTVFSRGNNAGGEAAHLGGAALGFYLVRHPHLLNWANTIGPRRKNMRIRYD